MLMMKSLLILLPALTVQLSEADDILNDAATIDRVCSVYCSGPILEGVQMAQLFDDSKTFVDMPLLVDPEEALAAWSDSFTHDEISEFVSTYFTDVGSELIPTTPKDWKEYPILLSRISNETMSSFAYDINQIWLQLYREMNQDVFENPQRYSILRRRNGLVLPGGRFRETYYWDSYWIVRGLILSDMLDTATGVVQNLLDDVTDFGFVPNGGRAYYTNRSQPPFLSLMVKDITRSKILSTLSTQTPTPSPSSSSSSSSNSWQTFLNQALPTLETEMNFWKLKRNVESCGNLSQYFSTSNTPRPESYVEDVNTNANSIRDDVYAQLCAGAESGWDFSTRWILPTVLPSEDDEEQDLYFELENITTSSIVPIDLNSVIYRAELSLAWLYELSYRENLISSSSSSAASSSSSLEKDQVKDQEESESEEVYGVELITEWLRIDERCLLELLNTEIDSENEHNIQLSMKSSCYDIVNQYTHDDNFNFKIYSSKTNYHLQQAKLLRNTIYEFLWVSHEGRWADGLLSWNNSYMFNDDDNNSANHHKEEENDEFEDDVVKRRSSGDVCSAIIQGNIHDVRSLSGWSAPLWAGLGNSLNDDEITLLLNNLLQGKDVPINDDDVVVLDDITEEVSGLIQPGGVRTTVKDVAQGGQQWDSPNSWAPLQLMLIQGLEQIGEMSTADMIAKRWLNSNWLGWAEGEGNMFEKYDAFHPGEYGGGGEYEPQSGFGWTNGVALELIERNYANGGSTL